MLAWAPVLAQSVLAQEPAAPAPIRHVFDISRNGDKIGTDTVEIDHDGDATTITSTTHITVTVAFITAYQFDHTAVETWGKGKFVSYRAHTNDNGTKYDVLAKADGEKLDLTVNGEHSELPQIILPATMWNKGFIGSTQLIDPDKGTIMTVGVKDLGEEPIATDSGEIQAHHYKITGDYPRDVWLANGVPVRFKLHGSDHSVILSDIRQ